jgi:phosphoribosyl-ATP pyrophosphohydrolase/phosphoribosyl-AMP cyclohydrolase
MLDCDKDCLLVLAEPEGPICHTGTMSCFGDEGNSFLYELENIIAKRRLQPETHSYTADLFARGLPGIAQKVGEEAVELVIESVSNNADDTFLHEAADLLFHFLILLQSKGRNLKHVISVLENRHMAKEGAKNS